MIIVSKCNEVGILTGGKWDKMYDQSRRVYGVDGLCPTIHTQGGGNQEVKIIVKSDGSCHIPQATKDGSTEIEIGGVFNASFPDSTTRRGRVIEKGSICPTLMASSNEIGRLDKTMRIRKLTPIECWRLMGFTDEDFHKAEKVCSNTRLYKQAGNSIVVPVLEGILRNLIPSEEVVHDKSDPMKWLDELFGGD